MKTLLQHIGARRPNLALLRQSILATLDADLAAAARRAGLEVMDG